MADRSFIYCPHCERQLKIQEELLRGNPESHLFRCNMGHAFTYAALMELNPTKIPMQVAEKPGATDIKIDFWLPPDLINKYRQKFPNQQNSTIASVLAVILDDDYVLVSGAQARRLRQLNIKNGADMVACAENNLTLTDQNEQLVKEVDRFYNVLREKNPVEA